MSTNASHTLELVSFKICPFVQRSVIALKEKGIDFKITYIDLANPPEWFGEISPLGKVPVLKVDDTVLFESAVISEFLDEVYPPSLHPASALDKARDRAWVEYGSELLGTQFRMLIADNEEGFTENRDELKAGLAKLEAVMDEKGPFFSGNSLSLIDTAYAPLFMRLNLVNDIADLGLFAADSRLGRWSEALLAKDSVQHSVVEEFSDLFVNFFKSKNSFAVSRS